MNLQSRARPITLVTDSTCDLSPGTLRDLEVTVVPLYVEVGDQSLRDGVDVDPRSFYELLETAEHSPRTHEPEVSDFAEAFASHADTECLTLLISSDLSETFRSAIEARGARAGRVEVVDSRSVSCGLGLLVIVAARMARSGCDVAEIRSSVETMIPRLKVVFTVNTLDYLQRGGRIGGARALLGRLLGVKPILGVADGRVTAVDRVSASGPWLERLVAGTTRDIDPTEPCLFAVVHARAPVWADRLCQLIRGRFRIAHLEVAEVGPIVATHTGPGTLGLACLQPSPAEMALLGRWDR